MNDPAAGRKKETKGQQNRSKLLQAAARVFVKQGFAQTTIRDIAKEAGVALGALYFHDRGRAARRRRAPRHERRHPAVLPVRSGQLARGVVDPKRKPIESLVHDFVSLLFEEIKQPPA